MLVAIDTNIRGTCALSTAGEVFCWGQIIGLPPAQAPMREFPQGSREPEV